MRISRFLMLPVVAALVTATPRPATAQVSVKIDARLGPEVGIYAYSADRWGDWHTNYKKWSPTVLYVENGHYYKRKVAGARAVLVYSYHNEYFFPPRDAGWVGFDKRYDYKRQPLEEDFGRARPRP